MKYQLPYLRHTQTPYIRLNTRLCTACWACVQACPQHVLGKVDFRFHRHAHIDSPNNCKGCLRCLRACPNQAILKSEKYS